MKLCWRLFVGLSMYGMYDVVLVVECIFEVKIIDIFYYGFIIEVNIDNKFLCGFFFFYKFGFVYVVYDYIVRFDIFIFCVCICYYKCYLRRIILFLLVKYLIF